MLSKKEVAVMTPIFEICKKNNDSGIISNEFLLESAPEKYKLTLADVDTILKQLEYDGYFECTKSDKNGKIVNVIVLKRKGKAFKRELLQRRREIFSTTMWRIIYAALGAVVALLVNKILGKF